MGLIRLNPPYLQLHLRCWPQGRERARSHPNRKALQNHKLEQPLMEMIESQTSERFTAPRIAVGETLFFRPSSVRRHANAFR